MSAGDLPLPTDDYSFGPRDIEIVGGLAYVAIPSSGFDAPSLRILDLSDPASPAHTAGGHLADVSGDGYPDLVSHYWIADSGISEATEQACASGQTFSGTRFEGCGTLAAALPRGRTDASGPAN